MPSPVRVLIALTFAGALLAQSYKTENVIFVMTDGLRWQEVFRGADPLLINKEMGGVTDIEALKKLYWRDTADQRRQALMPFLWSSCQVRTNLWKSRQGL